MEELEKNEQEETPQEEVITESSGLNNILKLLSFGVIAILAYLILTTSLKTCGKHDISYVDGKKYGEEEFDDSQGAASDTALVVTALDTSKYTETTTIKGNDTTTSFSLKSTPEKSISVQKVEKPASLPSATLPKASTKPVEKPAPVPTKEIKSDPTVSNNPILVIAGNYIQESNAKELQKKLAKAGIKNTEVKVFDFSEFYTVIVGRHKDMAEAKKMVSTLKSKGFDSYTHQKRKK